jgi:lipopolysaccharide export system permease protein
VSILLGSILGLSVLGKHSELMILHSNGVSLYQMAWSLIKATLLMVFLTVLIGEGLAPRAARLAENYKFFLTTNGQTLMTQQGAVWIRDGHNYIYIQSILDPTHLTKVSRYQFDDNNNLLEASFAKQVNYDGNSWNAYDISTSIISLKKIQAKPIAHEIWPFSFSPKLLNISIIQPNEMSLRQLNDYIRYRRRNLLNTSQYSLAFWQRILQPTAIWVMLCLAIPFTFKHLRALATSLRTIVGVAVGFGFYLLNDFFGPFAIVYQWPPFLAALLPILIFLFIAIVLMRWAR